MCHSVRKLSEGEEDFSDETKQQLLNAIKEEPSGIYKFGEESD